MDAKRHAVIDEMPAAPKREKEEITNELNGKLSTFKKISLYFLLRRIEFKKIKITFNKQNTQKLALFKIFLYIFKDLFRQSYIDQVILEDNRLNSSITSDASYMNKISEEFESFLDSFSANNINKRLKYS